MPPSYFTGKHVGSHTLVKSPAATFHEFIQQFVLRPARLSITGAEYHSFSKKEKAQAKLVGYVVASTFPSSTWEGRKLEYARPANLLILDVDYSDDARRFVDDPALLVRLLKKYNFAAYKTISSTPEAPRLRVIVEADNITVELYPDAALTVAAAMGLSQVTRESLIATQPMFPPTMFADQCVDLEHPLLVTHYDGRAFTEEDISTDTESFPPLSSGNKPALAPRSTGDALDDYLLNYEPPDAGITIQMAEEALTFIDADCKRPKWLEIAAALKHQFAASHDDDAYTLFDSWSATGNKYEGDKDTATVWRSFQEQAKGRKPVTIRSLLKRARAGGWNYIKPIRTIDAAENPEDGESSTNSTPGCTREHPIPEDSILASYRDFVRGVSELPDGLIVAPIIALCGKLLTPKVSLDFGGLKPLTIFNYVATPAGLRKSTTFGPAETIARRVLMADDQISGNASDSALFDTFEKQPHRLQFEDEGNTILRTWETAAYGREVSARYLKLYDGRPWTQNFRREAKTSEDKQAERHIDKATLSLCIGSTFGVAKLNHLDAGSGLRRRFGFYVATRQAREIYWPRSLGGREIEVLSERFESLTAIQGTVGEDSFTPDAMTYWIELQKRNRARCQSIPGYTEGDENLAASLNESPARCLKLAVIFQCCRYAAGSVSDPLTITRDVLELAEAHQDACLDALVEIESLGRRSEIEDFSESIMAQLSAQSPNKTEITVSKTTLTRLFAANPGRSGSLKASKLYNEIIPHMIRTGRAKHADKTGKLQTYTFKLDA